MSSPEHLENHTGDEIGDALRVGTWTLLAQLLIAAPDETVLERLRDLPESDAESGLAAAWAALRAAACRAQPATLAREYHELFIGVAQGEVVPYASYYRSGVLMDKALVQLRQDLARLGFERSGTVSEPEDHAATVCESMAAVIHDDEIPFAEQKPFFDRHVQPWMERFFVDVRNAPSADFYRAVAQLGECMVALERQYLSMLA